MAEKTEAEAQLEADIHTLEVGTRQLKVQYDMFFVGARKIPPRELRAQLERLIRRNIDTSHANYAQRFHLTTAVSRFNSLSELWDKTIRGREQGYLENGRIVDPRSQATQPSTPAAADGTLARCRVTDAHADAARLKDLYQSFVAAHEKGTRTPSFEKFILGVEAQSSRIRKKSGCEEIELRVVAKDGKVQLKARPGR
ncbi:MAG: hypothetical protein OEV00_07455 [Acidobacteriota bacterium]|nr:hypothetical protein [Acidobacteriota bacterium]MDH3785149.1 hypothetical protein [Acidobacteriota bacterium]